MAATMSEREIVQEELTRWVWPRPLSFDEFLDLFTGRDEIVELINGSVVLDMAAQFDHENLIAWLLTILRYFAEQHDLGTVVGSRTAVEIDEFNGRLPDILFVSRERMALVKQRAVYGPPDLVIEVRSPGDRKSALIALETDYRSLGVREILFIDPKNKRVRVLRQRNGEYAEDDITSGEIAFETVPGFRLQVKWLIDESRPKPSEVLSRLTASD